MRYESSPSPTDINSFAHWLNTTGRPDEWPGLTKTVPPETDNFEVVHKFDVPKRFRKSVPRAVCPICSPGAPKFFDGILVYYPDEFVVRAVGIDCARRYYGTEVVKRKLDEFRIREQISGAEEYLRENLKLVPDLIRLAASLRAPAEAVDAFRAKLTEGLLRQAWHRINNGAPTGVLEARESVRVNTVDSQGRQGSRADERVIASFRVVGLDYVANGASAAKPILAAQAALAAVWHDQDMDEATVLDSLSGRGEYLIEGERNLRLARTEIERGRQTLEEARRFVDLPNLRALAAWTNHSLVTSALLITVKEGEPATLVLQAKGRPFDVKVSIPSRQRLIPQAP